MANSISLEHTVFQWDIKNFSLCLTVPSYLTSHTFELSRSSSVWYMEIYAIRTGDSQFLISTHLCRNSHDQGAEEIKVRFSLHLRTSIKLISWEAENFGNTFRTADKHGGDFVLDLPKSLIFINGIDDTLTVTCEMISTVESRNLVPDVNPDFEALSADLKELFKSHDIPGNAFLDVGGKPITVHREILSARSSVLARLLESSNNRVEIPHFSEEVVKAMLKFLYSGDLSCVLENPLPLEIYRFATCYEISQLLELLEPQDIYTNTHINTLDFSYTWDIQNFAASCRNHNIPQSVEYGFGDIGMEFVLDYDTQHGNIIFSVQQWNLIGIISLSVEISIMDDRNNKRIAKTKLMRPDLYRRCSCIVFIDEKLIYNKEILISPCDTLRVRFNFKFLPEEYGTFVINPMYSTILDAWNPNFSPCSLPSQMKDLLESRLLRDAEVRVGGSVIDVHKSVLRARSSVFREYFRNSDRYDLENFPLAVVKQLVFYVYTGYLYDECPLQLIDLFYAATTFSIRPLERTCLDLLRRSRLRPTNVSRICIFADRENLADLKDRCMNFICNNEDRLSRQSWEELRTDHTDLHSEILNRLRNRN